MQAFIRFSFIQLFLLLFVLASEAQVKYDSEKFAGAAKMHRRMVETNVQDILRYDVKKVQIIECIAEITLSEELSNSSFPDINDFETHYKTKYPKLYKHTGEGYFENVLDVVYNRLNRLFFENGIKVTDKEQVITNKFFIEEQLIPSEDKKYTGSALSNYYDGDKPILSTSGMLPLPKNLSFDDNEAFQYQMAAIANDNEAQAALHVTLKIGVDEAGNPVIEEYKVTMDTWLSAFKRGSKTIYKWKVFNSPLFSLEKPVAGVGNHTNPDGTSIDLDAFDTELLNMIDNITEMFSYSFSEDM
ncbi:MAG: hypothetical protein ACOC10_06160 [Bacteroidota bacterium]